MSSFAGLSLPQFFRMLGSENRKVETRNGNWVQIDATIEVRMIYSSGFRVYLDSSKKLLCNHSSDSMVETE